ITERKKSEAEITRLAYYDGLTELPNRAFLADYIKYAIELAKRNKHLFTILSLDLDDFKRINNTWGQRVGNALLQTVAQRLTKCIRAADCLAWGNEHVSERPPQLTQSGSNTDAAEDRCATLARMGGDDFVIYMGDVHGAGKAAAIARRILTELSSPYPFHKGQVFLTASIGIAIFPADGQNVETLLAHAELAMHHAKKQGGNNFQFYKQSMNIRAHRRLILETELHKAIENKELEVYYQPKVVVADKRVSGMEALVRWHHPRKGLLPPSEFIALAEESDLIVLLGEQILHNACAQTRDWVEAGHDLHVAVNLSARQFRKKDLPRVIRDVLEETGLPPERLELEITEGLLMEDSETARTILFELKEMAVRIALDDFGTGYSSLSYLKRFPLDVLKIDRSFIQDVCVNRDTSSITSAIIALSKCLQLKNVAEGVETEAQLQFLREHKCDETQGYLFSPPLPAAKFIEWLHAAAGETCS
ncbi:MAG: EAL domain-containing protein, partial [Gammaproteobacteria bacterium]|nr:EAL domain-containing protein [Gammaproteobacteria bacterium]